MDEEIIYIYGFWSDRYAFGLELSLLFKNSMVGIFYACIFIMQSNALIFLMFVVIFQLHWNIVGDDGASGLD